MLLNDPPDHETIRLAVVDANFNLLEDQQVTAPKHFRPHLLIHDGYLYMVYDGTAVTIKKYKIDASSVSTFSSGFPASNYLKVFPNPFNNKLKIEFEGQSFSAKLFNQPGECLGEYKLNHSQELDLTFLSSGLYFLHVYTEEGFEFIKLVKR
jgi:hypothetical protein